MIVVCMQAFMAALAIGAVIPEGSIQQLAKATAARTFKNVIYFGEW